MDFTYSPKVVGLQKRLMAFMDTHIYPAESRYTTPRWPPTAPLATPGCRRR